MSTVYRLARALDVPPAVLLPAGGELVADICPPGAYGIVLRWPAEIVLEPFRTPYVERGVGPRYESLVVREPREDRSLETPGQAPGEPDRAVEGGVNGGGARTE